MTQLSREVLRRATEGDPRAREQVLDAHEGHLRWVVRRVSTFGGTREDYLQQARLGLLKALDRFDPDRGLKLWTYARWWVRLYVTKHSSENRSIVRMGETRAVRRLMSKLPEAERELGPEASDEEVARHLGVDEGSVALVRARYRQPDRSFDKVEYEATAPEPSAEEVVLSRPVAERRRTVVCKLLGNLRDRDRDIVERRYMSDPPETLASIGRDYGISRERVRQIAERARRRMRESVPPETAEELRV